MGLSEISSGPYFSPLNIKEVWLFKRKYAWNCLTLRGDGVWKSEGNGRRKVVTLGGCSRKDKICHFIWRKWLAFSFTILKYIHWYSLATNWPSVKFSWFSVTYICRDVLLTPSFELVAFFFFHMSPNTIMNHWSSRPSITVIRPIKDDNHQSNIFTPPETKCSQSKINTFPPAGLTKIYTPNMQIVLKVLDKGKHSVSLLNPRQEI